MTRTYSHAQWVSATQRAYLRGRKQGKAEREDRLESAEAALDRVLALCDIWSDDVDFVMRDVADTLRLTIEGDGKE